MLKPRIIPVLTLIEGNLVKTKKFKNPQYIGDPINAIRIFNEKEVDELIIIDINASKKNIPPNYRLIEDMCSECFMPLVYGGGIKNIEQARKIFSLGIEKICIQSGILDNPKFIEDLYSEFGKQSVILSLDFKKDWFKKYKLFCTRSMKFYQSDLFERINNLINQGVGELLITSINKDGSMTGPELDLITTVRKNIKIPLIYLGGISKLEDIENSIKAGANAVAAGSFFIYYGPHKAVLLTYPSNIMIEEIFKNINY